MSANYARPKAGALFLCTDRLRRIGEGSERGSYEQRQEVCADKLLEALGGVADVVFTENVYDRESLKKAIGVFYGEKVDYVLAVHLSWTEDFNWVRFLRDMPEVPILFACRTRDSIRFADSSKSEDEFAEFISGGNVVGALEASGSIERTGRKMIEVFCGTIDELAERARVFGAAARCRRVLRQSTVGLAGTYNEVMWSTYVDPYDVFAKIGPEIRFFTAPNVLEELSGVSDSDADRLCRMFTENCEIISPVDPVKFRESARASIAFERLAEHHDLDCLVINDIDPKLFEALGLRAGFIRCATGPAAIVPEGDIGSGIAALVLRTLSGGSVNYLEPMYVDREKDCIPVGHAGPADYDACLSNCKVGNDDRFAKAAIHYPGAPVAWYLFPEGRRTMLHFSQGRDRYKMVAGQIDCLPGRHFLGGYNHGAIRPLQGTCDELVEKLMGINVTQHYCLTPGDYTKEIECLSKLCGFSFFHV